MKTSFIEPAILLNAFAMTLNIPLTAQYVYRRIWEETGNYTFASGSNVSECKQNRSDPIFAFREVLPPELFRAFPKSRELDRPTLSPTLLPTAEAGPDKKRNDSITFA